MDKDKVEGKLKEWEGELTDDESREAEGEAQQDWGEAKDKARETLGGREGPRGTEYKEHTDDDDSKTRQPHSGSGLRPDPE